MNTLETRLSLIALGALTLGGSACARHAATPAEPATEAPAAAVEAPATVEQAPSAVEAKALVTRTVTTLFVDFDAEAAADLLAEDYIQHNPGVPTGAAAVLGFLPAPPPRRPAGHLNESRSRRHTRAHTRVVLIGLAHEDTHSHARSYLESLVKARTCTRVLN